MRKVIIILFSLLVLSACSNQQNKVSVVEAMESEGLNITESNVPSPMGIELDGIKPITYKLDNDEMVLVYDFATADERELSHKLFQEHQLFLSSYGPIVYQTSQSLILYYSNVNSTTSTFKLSETNAGEKIQKAIERME
ncbi:hypothetical protein J2T13_005052 [Paenibacillus sp. DS2015]|uniref:lipoprotein n=1 Tax=Paenibacillus sp. DS2015 TaxID=3373917 RepID=UPI003D1CB22C